MGQKKITELQLRSGVTDGLNLPSDDGIQSYRVTALQFFNYLMTKIAGVATVTPENDDLLPFVDISDSNLLKKATLATLKTPKVRSVTATDSPTVKDDILLLSGASFVVTLPDATTMAGKIFKLFHNGTTGSQIYTLNTTSSQTINGRASGYYGIASKNESIVLVSDGANWITLEWNEKLKETHIAVTGNGFGSTNTAIRRYSSSQTNTTGHLVTYADSSTLGGSWTVNKDCRLSGFIQDAANGGNTGNMGISLNSNQLTTTIQSITAAHRVCSSQLLGAGGTDAIAGLPIPAINLVAGDVIRSHSHPTNGSLSNATTAKAHLIFERIL